MVSLPPVIPNGARGFNMSISIEITNALIARQRQRGDVVCLNIPGQEGKAFLQYSPIEFEVRTILEGHAKRAEKITEQSKAEDDRRIFGIGVLVNGKHVPIDQVEILGR
jgi:hypothetical protein